MTILEYLPGISHEYWRPYEALRENLIIKKNTGSSLLPSSLLNHRGLFTSLNIIVNNPNLAFKITIDDRTITGTPYYLNLYGFNFYIPDTPFIVEYNTTDNIYSMSFITSTPGPFYENFDVVAENTTASDVTINVFQLHAYILNKGFYKELAKLKSSQSH